MEANGVLRAERAERLQRIGIPPSAAKAYAALVELGETEAREVARLSGIPFAKVYAALDQLHTRGLANIVLDTPRKYSPRPVDEYLAVLRKAREEELRRLDADQRELASLLHMGDEASADDRGTFTMIRGRRGSIKKIGQLIERAQEEILVVATDNFPAAPHFGEPMLRAAAERGVTVNILSQAAQRGAHIPGLLSYADVRAIESGTRARQTGMMIVDRAIALIVQFVPDDADARQGHDVGLFTSHEGIVLSIHGLVHARWLSAPQPIARASAPRS